MTDHLEWLLNTRSFHHRRDVRLLRRDPSARRSLKPSSLEISKLTQMRGAATASRPFYFR